MLGLRIPHDINNLDLNCPQCREPFEIETKFLAEDKEGGDYMTLKNQRKEIKRNFKMLWT